ncbi:MAG TPA: hypothetical protein VM009_07460 [Terriglobales bacterium]|nr:hypothetical protein [Terriglobales bacterium]
MIFRLLVVAVLLTGALPANADLKVVTRRSNANGAHKSLETKYIQGQRLRIEWGPSIATVLQCDLRKQLSLNLDQRLFYSLELGPDGIPTRSKVSMPARGDRPNMDYGNDYAIHLRDTGEKATIFGYAAWHVHMVTSARNRYSGKLNETVTDYWYIDLHVPDNCANLGFDWNEYLLTNAQRMKVTVVGQAKRGFAVLARTMTTVGEKKFESVREVTEISTAALDPQLFEAPKDFQPALQMAGEIYPNIADTPANRVKVGWDRFWKGVAAFLP